MFFKKNFFSFCKRIPLCTKLYIPIYQLESVFLDWPFYASWLCVWDITDVQTPCFLAPHFPGQNVLLSRGPVLNWPGCSIEKQQGIIPKVADSLCAASIQRVADLLHRCLESLYLQADKLCISSSHHQWRTARKHIQIASGVNPGKESASRIPRAQWSSWWSSRLNNTYCVGLTHLQSLKMGVIVSFAFPCAKLIWDQTKSYFLFPWGRGGDSCTYMASSQRGNSYILSFSILFCSALFWGHAWWCLEIASASGLSRNQEEFHGPCMQS